VSLAVVVLGILIAGLTAYAVLGGADFGAGFWELESYRTRDGARLRSAIHRSVGPVWEANHVWLIFVLVVLWTAFPRGFASIMSTLSLPIFLAGIGIILRGSAFAFQPHVSAGRQSRVVSTLFGVSSVVTPFAMGAAIGGIASGRVPLGNAAGGRITSWLNPTSVLTGTLAVAFGAYLAAVYLAADAARWDEPELAERFRARAVIAGTIAGGAAMAGLLVVRSDAPVLWSGLTDDALPLIVVSALCGIATLALVAARRFGAARITGVGAVAPVIVGWAVAQRPDLLPGELSVTEAAAGRPTLIALLVGVGVGACVLVPSLVWLFRLTLRGDLVKGDDDPSPQVLS
jgi:cytochrome bd ubiquinol oxidase subunit II